MSIKSFADKKLERLFKIGSKSGIQAYHFAKLERILDRLDAAAAIKDMDYPGSDLHQLSGRLKGFWAIKVSGNYRVWFRFEKGDAYDVQYGDYH